MDGVTPQFFTYYETDAVADMFSDAYTARLNDPTPETVKVMQNWGNMTRTSCARHSMRGHCRGAFAVVARDNAFCCPELNWDPGAPLTIRNGRHPLAEQAMRERKRGGGTSRKRRRGESSSARRRPSRQAVREEDEEEEEEAPKKARRAVLSDDDDD